MLRLPTAWISALSSALLGISLGIGSDLFFRGSPGENLSNGLLGACLGLLLSLLLQNTRLDSDAGLISDLLRHPDIARLVDDARKARDFVLALNKGAGVRRLYQDRLTELCTQTDWSELAQGELAIPPYRELMFNKDLLSICSQHLRAVAYQDERFWTMPEGLAFLEANGKLVAAGRRITRIFVFDHEIGPSDVEQMERQRGIGIQVRVLSPASVSDEDKIDFVVYDDTAVRVAQSSVDGRKRAVLRVTDREVGHYIERFKNLEERSLTLQDFVEHAHVEGPVE